ncbi:MAG: ATP-binding protein [Bacteroidota bacterium]
MVFPQEIGFPLIRNYSPQEYDNSAQVWGAFQDEKGVMYFGMSEGGGIAEYDGERWRVIDVSTTVFPFAQDTKKRLYVGAINDFGFLSADERGKKRFVSLRRLIPAQDLKFKAIWFTLANNDDIYFMSVDAIFKYTSNPQEQIKTYLRGEGGIFTTIFRHEKNIYVMQNGRGILRIGNDSLELVTDFYKHKPLRSVQSLSADSLLIVTRKHGLFVHHIRNNNVSAFTLHDTAFLNNNTMYASLLLPGKNFIMGSSGKGIQMISPDGTVLQQWNISNNLPVNSVYQIYKSPDDHLWFSTENGITRTETSTAWSYWNKGSGLEGSVMDVLRFDGKLYIATFRGIYFINKNNIPERIAGIPVAQCWKLFVYTTPEKKKMLLAGIADGVYHIDGTTATQIRSASHVTAFLVPSTDPRRILISSNPSLISMKYQKGKWVDEGVVEGVNDNLQESVEDKNGDLWISTYVQGIIRLTPDRNKPLTPQSVRYYTENDGLPSLRQANPCFLGDDIVFGTEKGLYVHNTITNRFESYKNVNDVLSEEYQDIFVIRKLNDGKIVLLPSSNKAYRAGFLNQDNNRKYSWINTPFRKLPQMELACTYQDSNGVVWFGGSEGLYRYNPNVDTKNYDRDFFTLIRKVSIKGDSVINFGEKGNTDTIEYTYNDVAFDFAAPFFDDESKTVFSRQLVGYDETWSEWSLNSSAVYTNLDEGNYTFKVKGKNLYGKESVVAEYSLRILPPWHRTPWAYVSYVVVLGIAIGSFDRWNKRRLRRNYDKEHEAEQLRQKQFSGMLIDRQEKERQRISREMHDGIGQELLILKHNLQLKLREMGLDEDLKRMLDEQSAAASNIITEVRNISHDLRPPELDRLGLTETIKSILKRIRNTKKIEILGEIDMIDGFFPKNSEINIVRIIQEVLNNILKHADATTATIRLVQENSAVNLTISDNGKGMDEDSVNREGLGMNDIKERVQLLEGTMNIISSKGTGTTFSFHFRGKGTNV